METGSRLRISNFTIGEYLIDLFKVVGAGDTLYTSLIQAVDDSAGHAAIQAPTNTSAAWDRVAVLDNVSIASAVISTWLVDGTIHA